MGSSAGDGSEEEFRVLVTGANSGLGFAICCRLIDEFLQNRPQNQILLIIPTTRSQRKGDETVNGLEKHLRKTCRDAAKSIPGFDMVLQRRVRFQPESLDLNSILSVQRLSKKLLNSKNKIDVLICNAGYGGFTHPDWPVAIWTLLTDWIQATTWPTFKLAETGLLTDSQIPENKKSEETSPEDTRLGTVFCANVFGHYLLAHYLTPLLSDHRPRVENKGRIIWMSSLEAYERCLDFSDFQSIKSPYSYEGTKRITDLLALTAESPSTAPWVEKYFTDVPSQTVARGQQTTRPKIYVAHPGICYTGIFPINYIANLAMIAAFYIARWCGSIWHANHPYLGAVAPVWLALVSQSIIDQAEAKEGKGKWGSAVNRRGNERVVRTETERWGWGGIVGEQVRKKGRKRGAKAVTEEDLVVFEEQGRTVWKEMERLRVEWENKLREAGVSEL
ncbi:hypothetical protein M501DRAFT_968082 [Patellaria atrata CBS 101060]|uniref:3-keto-steroid reductase n=1 Tax=Patellaria atrata CBS 101060 TaxID=1346257 RepID=A0A9P4SI09_9PEZI|nr:hypothetical protein M501DRAFT_968082 [Patellaria atrata CBS 101060]